MNMLQTSKSLGQYIIRLGTNGFGGKQILFRFPNNYGASVIRGKGSYGEAELAVVKFHGAGADEYKLVYDTPITGDVIGMETVAEMEELLTRIMALEA